jgi:NhaA family Na+:H+ antiporter
MFSRIKNLLKSESGTGILLIVFTLIALFSANSFLSEFYTKFLNFPVHLSLGELEVHKPLILWINDGLMAIFFFLIGLELKRERVLGELKETSQIVFPAIAAIGGMVVPAMIYWLLNKSEPGYVNGWAIPAATDIAFALGILSLLGSRVPIALKVFLTSVAIFDDIGAILIIALFYTQELNLSGLLIGVLMIPILFVFNKKKVMSPFAYFLIGLIMWFAFLKSGVHATLAGVISALFIPINLNKEESLLYKLEHSLHYWVAFAILPVFAFANAGVPVLGMEISKLLHPVTLGIIFGLVLGKPLGVAGFSILYSKWTKTKLPAGMSIKSLVGVSLLCGVGFTMSIFIGSLAFSQDLEFLIDERLGILIGSLCSGVLGYAFLKKSLV